MFSLLKMLEGCRWASQQAHTRNRLGVAGYVASWHVPRPGFRRQADDSSQDTAAPVSRLGFPQAG